MMKSNKIKTRLMIIIFIILSCTLIFLLSRKENAVEDTTGRGPAMSASFGGSVPSRYSDPWAIEYWLEEFETKAGLCAQHGAAMTYGRGSKDPTVKVTLVAWGTTITSKTFKTWVDKSWPKSVWWDCENGPTKTGKITSAPNIKLKISVVQQPFSGNGVAPGGTKSDGNPATNYTNGAPEFTLIDSPSYSNCALAWVLAETGYAEEGVPGGDHVNIAFWALQHNPYAVNGSVSTEYFSQSDAAISNNTTLLQLYEQSITNIDNEVARLTTLISDPSTSEEDKARYQNMIRILQQVRDTVEVQYQQLVIESQGGVVVGTGTDPDHVYQTTGESAQGGTALYNEALIFGKMWNEINSYGSYENTIEDKTNIDNIHVQFNSSGGKVNDTDTTDYETYYIVGPFSVRYTEYYTTLDGSDGGQFCGMCGVPVLTAKFDDKEPAPLTIKDDWIFVYAGDGDFTDETFSGERANFPHIPEKYNVYPHSEEQFYLKIRYQEGLHELNSLKFSFRYMTAHGTYNLYEGNERTLKWTAQGTANECTDGEDCDCGGHHENAADTDGDGTDDCSGGAVECDHGYYEDHWESIEVAVNAKYTDEKIDVQDLAEVTDASREYKGKPYGFDAGGEPGTGGVEKTFEWKIDLTTTLTGYVWSELPPDEKTSSSLIGQWDKDSGDDNPVNNVEVNVYLYTQAGVKSTKREKAIMHERTTGARVEFPLHTTTTGQWNWEDYTFEAPGSEKELFYVVEFQYDGQLFKDVPQLGNGTGANGYLNEQDCSHAYDDDMNQSDAERSKAVTEVAERKRIDESFGEITGTDPMSGDRTTGITYTTNSDGERSGEPDVIYYDKMAATSLNSEEFVSGGSMSGHVPVVSRLDEPYHEDSSSMDKRQQKFEDEDYYDRYRTKAITWYGDSDTYGCSMSPSNYRTKYPKNKVYWMDNLKFGTTHLIAEYMRHLNLGLVKREETDLSLIKDLYKVTVVVNEQKQVYKFNPYGLQKGQYVEFQQALENVRDGSGNKGYSLGLYDSDVAYSSMKRYESAISEVQERKQFTELRVFATYVIRLYNNSILEDAEFKEVRDYYDADYTVVQDDNYDLEDGYLKGSIVNDEMKRETTRLAEAPYYRICRQDTLNVWGATKEENIDGFIHDDLKWEAYGDGISHKTSSLKGIHITNEEYIEIFTTYEVDKAGYDRLSDRNNNIADLTEDKIFEYRKGLIDKDKDSTDHKNTAEISSYSTYYGTENVYRNYKVGWVAGRVDKDSAPNNIRYGDVEGTYEDDTFEALLLKLKFKEYEREITGVVFEDKKDQTISSKNRHPVDFDGNIDASETFEVKAGDGKYVSGTDKGLGNIEVSMYEVINLGELDTNVSGTYAGLEYYYKVPTQFYGTTGEGIQKTADDGTYKLDGFLAGDYVIRFDYGKEPNGNSEDRKYKVYSAKSQTGEDKDIIKYNGQDYENTKFLGQFIGEGDDSKLNTKFLAIDGNDPEKLKEQDVSKARDNESRRLEIDAFSRTIENERAEMLRDRIYDSSDESKEFVERTKMFSETPILKIEVEDPSLMNKDPENQDGDGKGKKEPENDDTTIEVYEYGGKVEEFTNEDLYHKKVEIPKIDFGVEERARTDLELKTFIQKIQILKADEIVFTVNVNDDGTLNYETETSRSRKLTSLPTDYSAGNNQQGFFSVEVENDYLNGLDLLIDYKIEILNNSDIDFTSRLARFYREDVINAYARNVPTSTFYENVMSDYKKVLQEGGEDVDTLKESDVTVENVFRLNSNALRRIFDLPTTETQGDSITEDIMQQMKNTPDTQEDDTIKPEVVVYGLFTGRYYYENKIYIEEDEKNTYTIKDYLSGRDGALPIKIEYDRDTIVRATVNKVVDYADVDGTIVVPPQGYIIDKAWQVVGEGDKTGSPDQITRDANNKIVYQDNSYKDFESLLSDASFRTEDKDTGSDLDLYDWKDRKYIRVGQSNIGFAENDSIVKMKDEAGNETNRQQYSDEYVTNNRNISLSRQIEPANYVLPSYMKDKYGGDAGDKEVHFQELLDTEDGTLKRKRVLGETTVRIVKSTSSSQEADEINIDNLVEVLVYSVSTGRRDIFSVPGNALAIGAYKAKSDEEKSVWYSGYNCIRKGGSESYNRTAFAARNLIANSARSTIDGEFPQGKINKVTQQWTLYPEDDQWAPEYVSVIPPTGIALRDYLKSNLPQVIAATIAALGLAALFIIKQVKIRRNKNKF